MGNDLRAEENEYFMCVEERESIINELLSKGNFFIILNKIKYYSSALMLLVYFSISNKGYLMNLLSKQIIFYDNMK